KPLLDTLVDGDPNEQRQAVEVLGAIGHPSAAAPLLALVNGNADVESRSRAVLAAGAAGDAHLLSRFEALLGHEERRIREAATWSIGRIHDRRAVGVLLRALGSELPTVRVVACQALGASGDARALAALVERLRADAVPQVRTA